MKPMLYADRFTIEGKSRGWPGLGQEVTDICTQLNITDVNNTFVAKSVIKEAIFNHHYAEMTAEVKKMKKLEPIKGEDFRETQKYFMDKSIENGRMSFQIRTQMLKDIPGNFKNKFRNDTEKLKCQHYAEDQVFTQSHRLECPGWMDIKKDLDLSKIEDIVKFFQRLLNERANSETPKV